MHLASEGVATGDSMRPFLARVTIGSKNRREVLAEFEAKTLDDAEESAAAWLEEYCARVGLGDKRLLEPAAMRARWERLHDDMPKVPEPNEAYCRALEITAFDEEQKPEVQVVKRSPVMRAERYPSKSKIAAAVLTARASGIDVAGIRIWRDGSIAVFDGRAGCGMDAAETAYDQWSQRKHGNRK